MKRREAQAAGLTSYFTGKPCKNGHLDKRWTASGSCASCGTLMSAAWAKKNDYYNSEKVKKYKEDNRDRIRKREAEYRSKNVEIIQQRQRTWNQANKEKRREYATETAHKRRAMLREVRSDLTREEISDLRKKQGGRCAYCKATSPLQIDHIIALSRGGENTKRNIQMLCKPCNLSKGPKHPIEFAQKMGLLL